MRIFLLDVSRGISVIAMIFYHFYWDLGYFGLIDLKTVTQGMGLLAAQLIGISFIIIAGISANFLTLSNNFRSKFSRRILKLIIISTLISVVTFLLDRNSFIFFGILHFLTVCSVLSLALVNIKNSYLLFLCFIFASTISLSTVTYDLPTIISWVGFNKNPPVTNDFYPLFPWITFYVLGFLVGQILITKKNRTPKNIADMHVSHNSILQFFEYMGRHSLIIYIFHQPILFSLFLGFIQLTS